MARVKNPLKKSQKWTAKKKRELEAQLVELEDKEIAKVSKVHAELRKIKRSEGKLKPKHLLDKVLEVLFIHVGRMGELDASATIKTSVEIVKALGAVVNKFPEMQDDILNDSEDESKGLVLVMNKVKDIKDAKKKAN